MVELTVESNPAYLIEASHGAVASENVVCSNIGVDILKDGGNAVDAIIGAVFCIGVVNMFSSGIGGGGFMTIRVPPSAKNGSSEVWNIDFRETAPALANTTMYVGNPAKAMFGGLSVAVPGEVKGLEEAHKRWGKLEWSRLVQPSVELAAGWKVGVELGRRMNLDMFRPVMLGKDDWRSIFAPNGVILTEGEIIHRANYSKTLAAIAADGSNALYHGEIAEAIVRKVQSEGGVLSLEDMANYKVTVRKALQGTYRGRKVYTTHAPTSGPVLLHMLNLLETYDIPTEGRTGLNVHRYVEAMKCETRICDPAFNNDPQRIEQIPRKSFSALISKNLTDDRTHSPDYYQPIFDAPEDHGTSHTSVVDKDGMAVALTTTVNLVFGSLVMDPVTGIIMNDEMDDFSTPGTPNAFGLWPSPFNYPEPGKRPLSSTVPTIIEHTDGSFYLAIGGSGGSKIFPAVFQVILNLDWGYDASQAIEYGRLHDQLFPSYVEADDIYPGELLADLERRGHNITILNVNRVSAVVQAVMKKDGKIFAASDSRKNGIAAGY
ncbi:hypothetical protein HETIRDRAFT_155010 [Heterobasidion irregulare TC 32-1]|uniref:Gamma-glutamyltranspeptidase n=1 Tax=Heterobasidion irregulare (strain TC 32-1) TaxID=747525 RepID=W4K5C1_HETIT|nr:uncharacterized protein HETIRDRAFT_155010 [Heterobasidion irregulare TC 32-1]ETW81007.1 hypothetical protein HETIRDRAFT_155010 [Heterobasidion irregulare TC 32-1]